MNEFSWPVRVYYEDTDLGGVVYYANYLKFMERARTEWLRALDFEQDELITNSDVLFAVRNVEVEYLKPARFNDQLQVSVTPVEIGRASLVLEQEVRKENGLEVLCKGVIKIASLRASTFRPCPIPVKIQEKLTK